MATLVMCFLVCASFVVVCNSQVTSTQSTETTTEPETTTLPETTTPTTTEEVTTQQQCGENESPGDPDCICDQGYYRNISGICSECAIENCTSCHDNASKPLCLACDEGFRHLENTCVTKCPLGYRPSDPNKCEPVHPCTFQYGEQYIVCLAVPLGAGIPLVVGAIVATVLLVRRKRANAADNVQRREMVRRPSMPNPFEENVNRRQTLRGDQTNETNGNKLEIITPPRDPRYTPEPTMKVGPPIIPARQSSHYYEDYENVPVPQHGVVSPVFEADEPHRASNLSSSSTDSDRVYENTDFQKPPPKTGRTKQNLQTNVPLPSPSDDPPPPSGVGHTAGSQKPKHSYVNLTSLAQNSASPGAHLHGYVNTPRNSGTPNKNKKAPRRVESVHPREDEEQSIYANS